MAMNIFRLIGDRGRDLSILLMIKRLRKERNGTDVSIKTQEFFCIVYLTRYLDLFTTFYSLYNYVLKILYITSSLYILHLLHSPSADLRQTLKKNEDISRRSFVLVPPAIVAFVCTVIENSPYFDVLEYFWAFSVILEAWAMIPQVLIIHRKRCAVDKGIRLYCFFQFCHRFFYILNWIYRSYHEPFYQHHFLVYSFGVIHCLLIVLPWVWKYFDIDPFQLLERPSSVTRSLDRDNDTESGPLIYHLIVDSE
mmetsp:Transcript_70/g.75  ORF Transcript_70/g.75 Transcript_70/m.75 type:complete len:252 (-) Transcript_70:596-1351(-)